jgi:hypothetical protein
VWGRGEANRGFWWGNLGKRDDVEYVVVGGRIILKFVLK